MITERDAILGIAQRLAGKRPVRWADAKTSAGDFDGREWTLEIFDVARNDRLELREKLWDLFAAVRKSTGHSISLITHTPEDTTRFYAWVRATPGRECGRDVPVSPRQHVPPRRAA